MDDLDHVLNYMREEYQYQIWALVGHSRGRCLILCEAYERRKCGVSLRSHAGSVYTIDSQLLWAVLV